MSHETGLILVTGGTGTLGSRVVPRLGDAGRPVRVLSRTEREGEAGVAFATGDLDTGEGIDAAVEGVEVVVNCAGSNAGDDAPWSRRPRRPGCGTSCTSPSSAPTASRW